MEPETGGRFPANQGEFGERLRGLRGRRGLRQVARQAFISAAQLSRYERGEILPSLEKAEALDRAYGADGWIVVALSALWRPRWQPWKDEWPSRFHAATWPAAFRGLVWIKIIPATDEPVTIDLDLEWGPWGREEQLQFPQASQGIVLTTLKAVDDDGVSRTLNLKANKEVFALFGAGDHLEGEVLVMDIHRGWVRRNEDSSDAELRHGPDVT